MGSLYTFSCPLSSGLTFLEFPNWRRSIGERGVLLDDPNKQRRCCRFLVMFVIMTNEKLGESVFIVTIITLERMNESNVMALRCSDEKAIAQSIYYH